MPIIVISRGAVGSGQDYLEAARLLGAGQVLLKPFPPALLIAAITELLPGDIYDKGA